MIESTYSFSYVLTTVFLGLLSVSLLFFSIWIVHLLLKNAAIADIGWGPGCMIIFLIYIIRGEGFSLRNLLLFLLVCAWGLRIVLFLIRRFSFEKKEDPRYQRIRKDWRENITIKFLSLFLAQGLMQIILSTPFLFTSLNPQTNISFFEILGAMIILVGLIGESIADEQLFHFKSNPDNHGQTCDKGLWHYSRHPNYFFEWLVWLGFAIYALGSGWGWLALSSPTLIYVMMIRLSGVPLAEDQALQTRGENYRRYRDRTNMFFPGKPKNISNS